jgi:hypothetical protein
VTSTTPEKLFDELKKVYAGRFDKDVEVVKQFVDKVGAEPYEAWGLFGGEFRSHLIPVVDRTVYDPITEFVGSLNEFCVNFYARVHKYVMQLTEKKKQKEEVDIEDAVNTVLEMFDSWFEDGIFYIKFQTEDSEELEIDSRFIITIIDSTIKGFKTGKRIFGDREYIFKHFIEVIFVTLAELLNADITFQPDGNGYKAILLLPSGQKYTWKIKHYIYNPIGYRIEEYRVVLSDYQ